MSSKFCSFTTFFTVLWLAMFVEKSVCPNGKPPPPLSPTSGPWMPGTHLGSVGINVSPPNSPLSLDTVFFGGPPPSSPSSPTPSSNKPSSVPTSDWPPFDVPPYWPPPSTMPVQSRPWLPSSPVPGLSGVSGPPSLDSVVIRGRPFSPLPSPIPGPDRPPQPPQPPSPIPGPRQPPQPPSSIPRPRRQLYPALMSLKPRPGQPGSPQNPGTIIPGPTQKWLASVFFKGLLPAALLRRENQVCSKRTICREGTCCLETSHRHRTCRPLGKRGDRCSEPALAVVYFGYCPCGVHEGVCLDGFCR
ncbi:uncharacterized protein LOC119167607 isoform X2 [Rhipicephalus microplus]|uniref:uncharacterized protein LOC119167607 isoform X2 n=1 Tax=Rhipicephalus microplus TaxID=6941 RepID=UPI003F6D9D37